MMAMTWRAPRRTAPLAWSLYSSHPSSTSKLPLPDQIKQGASIRFRGSNRVQDPARVVYTQKETFVDSKHYKPVYFNMNSQNEKQALYQRVLKQTPQPTPLIVQFEHFVRKHLFTFLPKRKIKSDTMETYLRNSNAAPSVKRMIHQAHLSLQDRGISEHSSLSSKVLHSWTTRSSFVKVENLNYSSEAGVKQKAPRLIQGAKPEFISLVGPWFSAFQRHVKRFWGKKHYIYFTSGASTKEMGDYIASSPGQIFENDVAAFDSSIGPRLCDLEIWIAKQFGAPRAVVDLMTHNAQTHGFTHTGWQYKVPGTRKSGDPYTSVFNSMLNAFMHLFVFHLETGISPRDFPDHLKMVVQGDDMLMRHSGSRLPGWRHYLLQLGFDTESIYREQIRDAEFCSSVLVSTSDGGHVFVPKFGKVLAKFGYFINPPMNTHPKSLLRGVALGLANLRFLPWYDNFLQAVMDYTAGYVAVLPKKVEEHRFRLTKVESAGFLNKYEVAERYHLSIENHDYISSYLRNFEGGLVWDPLVRCVFDRDNAGPKAIYCAAA